MRYYKANFQFFLEEINMAKSQEKQKKDVKKKPAKSLKEKRAAKKEKRGK
jgi:hypothetical protein